MNDCARRLKELRGKKSSLTVSKDIGISRSSLQMYEAGLRVPKDEVKIKLANYYGISVQELFYA